MNRFPPSFSERDIQQAKAGISLLALEYIERLEEIARTATEYMQHTTAYTPYAYKASMNLSAALSRITLVSPSRCENEFVTSGSACNNSTASHNIFHESSATGDLQSQLGDQCYRDTLSHIHMIEEQLLREQLRQKTHYQDALDHLRMMEIAIEGIKLEQETAQADCQVDPQLIAHNIEHYQREILAHNNWLIAHGFPTPLPAGNITVQSLEKQDDDGHDKRK